MEGNTMLTDVVVEQAAAISDLLRQKNTAEKELILKNFRIGRIVSQACQDFGEDIIPEIMSTLASGGTTIFDDFLDKSRSVFESYKTEPRLLEVGKELGPHFNWSFLASRCFKPKGSSRATDLYVDGELSRAERAIGAVENLLVSDLPDKYKELAVSLVPYVNGHRPGKVSKVAHLADLHYDDFDMLPDIVQSAGFIIERLRKTPPDLTVIAGDTVNCRLSHDSPALQEAISFVKQLADISPVFILKGTTNHDGVSVKLFEGLKATYEVYVSETIETVGLKYGHFWPLERFEAGLDCIIYALPPVSKANILANLDDDTDAGQKVATLVKDIFQGWGVTSDQARRQGIMTVLTSHGTLTGSVTSTGQKMVGRDIEFGYSDVQLAKADVVCLGHIHKAQDFGNVFYSGSIAKLNVGEQEDKGFRMHQKVPEGLKSQFVVVPTRDIIDIQFDGLPDMDRLPVITKDAIVRIRYKVSDEEIHSIDEEAIREQLRFMGASDIRVEKSIIPKQTVRAEGISQLVTFADKFRKSCEAGGVEVTESLIQKVELLQKPFDVVCLELGIDMPKKKRR